AKGRHLQTLKVHFTDKYFGDEVIKSLVANCPNLKALALSHIDQRSAAGVRDLAGLRSLNYLSLLLNDEVQAEECEDQLQKVGRGLPTLSLRRPSEADDSLLETIREHCSSLVKLRITECGNITDAAFTKLFSVWKNQSLVHVDLAKC